MTTFQEELAEILYNVRSRNCSETPKDVVDDALAKIDILLKKYFEENK